MGGGAVVGAEVPGGANTADKTKQVTNKNKTGGSDMKVLNEGAGGGEGGERDVGLGRYDRYERSRKLFGPLNVPFGM